MPRSLLAAIVAIGFSAAVPASEDEAELAETFANSIRPTLLEFCGSCHGPDDKEEAVGFLRCETAAEVTKQRGVWRSAAEQLRNRTMPPADKPQPSEQQRLEASQWIEAYLEATACSQGDFAGRPVPRRLNRDQYTCAIEDLTGEQFDFVETFPADGGGGEGFDNNGETLFLPPLLMERYMEVAQSVLDHVIVSDSLEMAYVATAEDSGGIRFVEEDTIEQPQAVEMTPGTNAGIRIPVHTEADFVLALETFHSQGKPVPIVLSVDGIDAKELLIPANNAKALRSEIHFARGIHHVNFRAPQDASPVMVERLHLYQTQADQGELDQRRRATERLLQPGDPWKGRDQRRRAAAIVRRFARAAWRRGPTEQEVERLLQLYDRGVQREESFPQAIKLPLKAVLVSPKFLFVAEQSHHAPGIHRISDLELATRLSLFLWHSLPDEPLLKLAETERLHQADVLKKQVRRMLRDPRSDRFAKAFSGQWLGTVAVGRSVIPDTNHFRPAYTTELVTDLRRQVTETMALMLRENRPVTEWLDCDYVVVNKRLAEHYQLEPVPTSHEHFEKISVNRSPRPGVLGMGAVHMLTSYSRRTSPVLRGGWVLETIFGAHLPAPPPDAGNLNGGEKEVADKTVRQRLEQHRENPTCAACHDLIDPIGFALENFDVLGRWRDKEGDRKVDAVGELPSGETFEGPEELRQVLLDRKDEFVRQFTRQMLGFALARSLEDADSCTISALTARLKDNRYRIEELVLGIVQSIPFQYRQGI